MKQMCVCVLMLTHCTITRFGFRARQIDGIEYGLFSIYAPLGQTTLRVGRVSVQCIGVSQVRVILCVSVCVVWDDDERQGEGETRCRLIACSYRKAPMGPPGLMSPSDGRITINSTIYLFNIHTAEGACDVQFSDQKVYISTPPSPEVENFKLKITTPSGIEPRTC